MSIRNVVLFTLLLTLSLFALACQKHDQPVAPQVAQPESDSIPEILRASIESATAPIHITSFAEFASAAESVPNVFTVEGNGSPQFSRLLSMAPNPESANLALQAYPSASSYWPWIPPGNTYLMTPDHANNGNPSDAWHSQFYDSNIWFRLDWSQAQTISRVYINHNPWYWLGQTVSSIRYLSPSGVWSTVPVSFPIYSGYSTAPIVDVTFPPVEAVSLIVYMRPGPQNPHPNWAVFISEIEVYGGASLKIVAPPENSVFDFGQSINFIGSQTGNITNIEWVSSIDDIFAADTLSVTKSNLSPGTHTITLRGIIGGPPASIRSSVGPSPQIRAAAVGDPVSATITIMIREPKPYIRVLGIDFLSSSVTDNRNRLYDRKGEFKSAPVGQKFLEPTQWEGAMSPTDGYVTESLNWPVCYVRDGATSLTEPSKIKLTVKVDDFNRTSNSGPIDVEASGTIYGDGGFQQPFEFSPTTFNPNSWPNSFSIESTTTLPNVVGVWSLEINWVFKKSGQLLSNQRTPKTSDFHRIYLTWDKTIVSGNFKVGEPTPGGFKAESMPTEYLEIVRLSCSILKGHSPTATENGIIDLLFDGAFSLGLKSPPERFSYSKDRVEPSTSPRGIDRLLEVKDGWCAEWGYFLKSLLEHNGIDFKQRGYNLESTFMDGTHAMVADGSIVAVGGIKSTDLTEPKFAWLFGNHVTTVEILGTAIAFDPTFHRTGPFISYVNNLFDFYENVTTIGGDLVDADLLPNYAAITEELE